MWELVPELMPETWTIVDQKWQGDPPPETQSGEELPWFVKETDRNWGTSVLCCSRSQDCMGLTQPKATYVVQQHIPDTTSPLACVCFQV